MGLNMISHDASGIEEKLTEKVCDAIGGVGSLSFISGGSVEHRHAIITQVLIEVEVLGCLTAKCDCTLSMSGTDPLVAAVSALMTVTGGKAEAHSALPMDDTWPSDRSYRMEMDAWDLMRSLTAENTVLIVVEEIGAADQTTLNLFGFLAKNIGGMNAIMIATHSTIGEDRLLQELLEELRRDIPVNEHHLHEVDSVQSSDQVLIRHEAPAQRDTTGTSGRFSSTSLEIERHISSSQVALAQGNVLNSILDARSALDDALSVRHYGLMLDSYIALGNALTQAGKEGESLGALDRAIDLAIMIGEPLSQYAARLRKSELLLFSTGEPDFALLEAIIAGEIGSRTADEVRRIEPLALMAIIEARNGRRDRAEMAFCDASVMLEKQPADKLVHERMLLALAAAILLESRHDLAGMNARYGEADVLATGTHSPAYWSATILLQRGRSLLGLRRPREAKIYLDESARQFDRLGNIVQYARAQRAAEESETGPVLD